MIGILAPYGRNETTSAAIRLADLFVGAGKDVRLIACGVHEQGVHQYWDSRVRSSRCERILFSANRCNAFIHFVCDNRVFDGTTLVSSKAPQILVPNWTTLTAADDALVKTFTTIVCPSKAAYKSIKSDLFGDGKIPTERLTWMRWDAGINSVVREGTVADGTVRVLFHCDHSTIDYCGPTALRLVDEVLERYEKVEVSLVSTKSWTKNDRRTIAGLKRKWKLRFAAQRIASFQDQMTAFHTHDWVVLPGVHAAFGSIIAKAAACSVPVIAHNLEPFNEMITPEHNGLLVECANSYTSVRAPVAVPDTVKWLATLHKALRDNTLLFRMQSKVWQVAKVRETFEKYWLSLVKD